MIHVDVLMMCATSPIEFIRTVPPKRTEEQTLLVSLTYIYAIGVLNFSLKRAVLYLNVLYIVMSIVLYF